MTEITFDQGWTDVGRITAEGGKFQMPSDVPDRPGLYCLKFNENSVYYGEAGDLKRRIGDYLKYYEATGIESEFRINKALGAHEGANVLIATGEHLQSRSQRCTIENRLIRKARAAHWNVLNGGSLAGRIAFHAAEIMRLSAKLESAESTQGGSND